MEIRIHTLWWYSQKQVLDIEREAGLAPGSLTENLQGLSTSGGTWGTFIANRLRARGVDVTEVDYE